MPKRPPAQGLRDAGVVLPDYLGHRERLHDRFEAGGGTALADYELLELLLFYALPRRDTKPIAERLLAEFKTFGGVLAASREQLARVDGVGDGAAAFLKAIQAASQAATRSSLSDGPIIGSAQALIDYCKTTVGDNPTEEFRVLFLDTKNRLKKDEPFGLGTVDFAPVYPREVVTRALELDAKAVILVHNHPSGDPRPSRADIEMTQKVRDACAVVGVALHDHIVIARGGHVSFKSAGLL
jgi:DNA repair protein RadC